MKSGDEEKPVLIGMWALSGVFFLIVTVMSVVGTPSMESLLAQTSAVTTEVAATTTTTAADATDLNEDSSADLININTATKEELMQLSGIGDVLATRIIEFREQHGNFYYIDDLLQVEGIGEKKLEAMRPYITV